MSQLQLMTTLDRGNSISIQCQADYDLAVEYCRGVRALDDEIAAEFKDMKQAADAAKAKILEKEKARRGPLAEILAKVKGFLIAWDTKKEKEARELAERQQLAIAAAAATIGSAIVPQVPVDTKPRSSGSGGKSTPRVTWTAELLDGYEETLPEEYWIRTPDLDRLHGIARQQMGNMNIPGVRAVSDRNIVIKR